MRTPKFYNWSPFVYINLDSMYDIIIMNGGGRMKKIEFDKSLQACYPEIAVEWHPTLNGELTPSNVHNGGSAKVFWLCPSGHTYQKSIAKRTKRGQGCPQCRIEKNAFANVHPELLQFYDYKKNEGIDPRTISYGSETKAWWKCPEGHSYEQPFHAKSSGAGCPICLHQQVAKDNCLAVLYPEIAKEWHPTKNDRLTAYDVMPQSHKEVWWLCLHGHEFLQKVYVHYRSGCPICDSEKRTSFPEQAIQYYLNKLFMAESRCKLGGFEADIYCPSIKVAIEYDGEFFHSGVDSEIREERKNQFFIEAGILLFRVKETKKSIDFICNDTKYGYEIKTTYTQDYYFVKDVIAAIISRINERFGKNYIIDVDIVRDKVAIINLYAQQKEENSFLIQKPLGAQKWDYEKNGETDLRLLPRTSKKKYWWKCPTCGNEWYGTLDSLVNSLTCNKCTRQVKSEIDMTPEISMGENAVFREFEVNLQTENTELASQWHPTKNGNFKPIHVAPRSGKRVWWLCPECGNEWPQYIKTRNNGKGARKCPICANNQKKDNTDSIIPFPDILFEEWHPTKNGDKKLTDYTPGSTIKVWWKCSKCGNDYECPIKTRKNGGGCNTCAIISRNTSKYKMVRNLDTGEIYESVMSAAEKTGTSRTSLSQCLNGRTKTAGGYRWEYYYE